MKNICQWHIVSVSGLLLLLVSLGVACIPGNTCPLTPYCPSGSSSGQAEVFSAYSASTVDPDGDQLKYIFDWGDGDTSETGFLPSGTTATSSHSWNSPGTYYISVKVIDTQGASSGWSDTTTVVVTSVSHHYQLTTSCSPPGSGTVMPGSGTYEEGATISVTAQPSFGYMFDHWGSDGSGASTATSIVMNSDKHVIAYFADIAWIHAEFIAVAPRIHSISQLDGLKIAVDASSKSVECARIALLTYGVRCEFVSLPASEHPMALLLGICDAALVTQPHPWLGLDVLIDDPGVNLLPWSDAAVQAVVNRCQGAVATELPANTYQQQPMPISAYALC